MIWMTFCVVVAVVSAAFCIVSNEMSGRFWWLFSAFVWALNAIIAGMDVW